jgi:hypothetical protein
MFRCFQMFQFLAVMSHSLILFFHNPCGFPLIHSALAIAHMLLFFVLFAQVPIYLIN